MQISWPKAALLAIAAASVWAGSASAQENEESSKWSVTLTPRYQQAFFLPAPEADGLESIPTYGASVELRTPDTRWGVLGTYLRGKGNGVYTYDDALFQGDYRYRARRQEFSVHAAYTPGETNITLLAGYHRFTAKSRETLITAAPGNSENNFYRHKIDAAEVGIRLASRLGQNSRQSISAQFLVGVGRGRYKADENEVFGGTSTVSTTNEKGTGYIGDIALGYNLFLTDFLSVGARGRGYVFYIDANGADPIFAVAPELNFSIRF